MNILLIEDEAGVREVLVDMLRALGHSVLAVADGLAGLRRLQAGDPVDVVLTDLKMPGMSGLQVFNVIKERWPDLPVGIITGTPESLAELREPVDVIIHKPVGLDALQRALSRLRGGPDAAAS